MYQGIALPASRAVGADLLGEDLEEWFILHRRDGKFALGAVVAEARALSAGDKKRGDLSLPQKLVPALLGILIQLAMLRIRLARIRLHGLNVLRQRQLRLAAHLAFSQLSNRVDVQRGQLPEQLFAAPGIELVPES